MRLNSSACLLTLSFSLTGLTACAQSRSKNVVPAVSSKELLANLSVNARRGKQSDRDGISSVTYARLFKEGEARYRSIDARQLSQLPPLPKGYDLFNNLAFHVETAAVSSGPSVLVFNIPSAASRLVFDKLRILHLEHDELSPTNSSWVDRTVVPGGWREDLSPLIEREAYDKLNPHFPSRTVPAAAGEFGVFAVALSERSGAPRASGPFTDMSVDVRVWPQPVQVGSDVTYTFTIVNGGPGNARYVGFTHPLDTDMRFLSAAADRGSCKESTQSPRTVLCLLGGLSPGEKAVVTITAKILPNPLLDVRGRQSIDTATVVFKEDPTDIDSRSLHKQVTTSIVPRR